MHASIRSVRIAPKKANIIAKMVRGMPVPAAISALSRTHKKAARIVEDLLKSAAANARQNDKQDPEGMIIKTIVVNQGTALHRGVPKARGQMRPMKKYLSHIHVTLGYKGDKAVSAKKTMASQKMAKKDATASSQAPKTRVKKTSSTTKQKGSTKKSSESAESSVSSES